MITYFKITPLVFASQWFPTLYTYTFPTKLTAKIWDVFVVEGLPWLCKVALAILKIQESQLLKLDFDSLLEKLKICGDFLEPNLLFKTADSMVTVTPQLLAQLRQEFESPTTNVICM